MSGKKEELIWNERHLGDSQELTKARFFSLKTDCLKELRYLCIDIYILRQKGSILHPSNATVGAPFRVQLYTL